MLNALQGRKSLPLIKLEDDLKYVFYIQVFTDDREHFRLLVDTGASFSFLFTNIKRAKDRVSFASGSMKLGNKLLMNFDFGPLEMYEVDGGHFEWMRESGIHGIVGMNFLVDKFLDLSNNRLYL